MPHYRGDHAQHLGLNNMLAHFQVYFQPLGNNDEHFSATQYDYDTSEDVTIPIQSVHETCTSLEKEDRRGIVDPQVVEGC